MKFKHGHALYRRHSATYRAWQKMKERCDNPKIKCYPRYGGIGIKVCRRWYSFVNFLKDMGEKPDDTLSLDRINPHGNYTPKNSRWADNKTQARNRRGTIYVTINGVRKPLKEWAETSAASYNCIFMRIYRMGWTAKDAVLRPPRVGKYKRRES